MKLTNTSIYSSATGLYIASGDHNLVEIAGADVPLVEKILVGLANADTVEGIYEQLRAECQDDRDYFDAIVAWLLEQNIVQAQPEAARPPVATYLHAPHLPGEARAQLLAALSAHGTQQYSLVATYAEAEFMLLLAPLFEYQAELQQLNAFAYRHHLPMCHLGVDTGTFTIGPLINPSLRTPCLSCYLRRKLANLKNPAKTLTFIQHTNKNRLAHADPRLNPYLNVALIHLAVELDSFFKHGRAYSPLLGKSIVFEHLEYSLTKSKILRVPGCEVCNAAPAYAAFNP